jgi:hypothetical protein
MALPGARGVSVPAPFLGTLHRVTPVSQLQLDVTIPTHPKADLGARGFATPLR